MPKPEATPTPHRRRPSSAWERRRAKGWQQGSAADFLDLTSEEATLVDLKLDLSRTVRERRQDHGLTQRELAERLGSSQSRVAKIEAGDPSVSLDLLVRALLALGMTLAGLGRLVGS